MKDEELERAFEQGPKLPAALAETIRARIRQDTNAVKPMPSPAIYACLFTCVTAVVAILFAIFRGFGGWNVLTRPAAMEFVAVLLLLALFGGAMVARAMRPGSGSLNIGLAGGLALTAYEALVLILFRDYSTDRFVHQGVICLAIGVSCAIAAAIPLWFVVKRGLIVEPVRAGALIGLLGGLAGLMALTLHCPVVTTPHAGVWHAAVIVVCVAAGALLGRVRQRR